VAKEDKAGKIFKRAFEEYSSRLFVIKEALRQGLPESIVAADRIGPVASVPSL
jgi:hypothetical protein